MAKESTAKHRPVQATDERDRTPVPASGPAAGATAADQPAEGAAAPEPGKGWPREIGGPRGPEPTRYGDWERKGRVSDF